MPFQYVQVWARVTGTRTPKLSVLELVGTEQLELECLQNDAFGMEPIQI